MDRTAYLLLALVGSLLCVSCAVNPVTGENQLMLISPAQEQQIGAKYAPAIEEQLGGPIQNQVLQNYVNSIGQRVAAASLTHRPNLRFRYTALNDKSINAMALPGGYVFITKGTQITNQMINLGHSREHEYQADSIGTDYLVDAGFSCYAMIETMEILQQQNKTRPFEYFSTHPDPAKRKENIRRQIASRGYPEVKQTATANYRKFVLENLN